MVGWVTVVDDRGWRWRVAVISGGTSGCDGGWWCWRQRWRRRQCLAAGAGDGGDDEG
ncbi:hypothetical protein HanIR_Chr11g0506151 [Helianthus annuus]|nr:hypothetical protein HanIR_Chr11g0506151 [Helianthus annuus]